MHIPCLNKLGIASFALCISFFLQNCNLPASNLPSIISNSKHTQPSYWPNTNLNSPPEEEAIVSAPSLPILPIAQVFTASSGEKISFSEEAGIWQAKIVAAYLDLNIHKALPVICEHQGDILTTLNRLAQQRPTIHKHRIHLLPSPSQSQCVFLGFVGLLGGMEAAAASANAALQEAVKTEELALVESLLASGADPNSLDQDGFTPLENAILQDSLALVNLLLANGAEPNQPTSLQSSYLHIAAMKNYVEIAKVLIENGADINATTTIDNIGYTPLDLAVTLDYVAVVQLLLENGAKPSRTKDGLETFHWAAEQGHLEILNLLLESEPAFNLNIMDYNGFTLLALAAKQGHVAVASLLLAKGADPNMPTEHGLIPLHWAADNGHLDLVTLLLEKGANCNNTVEPDGFTPLHLAVDQNYIAVARLLLEKGADPNIATENGATPLHWAAYNGHLEQINLLLDKGADLNITDYEGRTPLHIAANQGQLAIILRMLAHKPNPNLQNNHGESFLHILVDNNRIECKDCLHILQEAIKFIESRQHAALNQLLGVMKDCSPELTNQGTKNIVAMMVDYVEGLDLSLKNQRDSTVLDILQVQLEEATEVSYQDAEEVIKTLKRHQKLGGWLTSHRQKRMVSESAISNEATRHPSDLKKAKYQ
jgi:ankyrin repeat protein